MHRVVYFKCVGADGDGREEKEKGKGKGKIWWDRRDRRDWVFGGGREGQSSVRWKLEAD